MEFIVIIVIIGAYGLIIDPDFSKKEQQIIEKKDRKIEDLLNVKEFHLNETEKLKSQNEKLKSQNDVLKKEIDLQKINDMKCEIKEQQILIDKYREQIMKNVREKHIKIATEKQVKTYINNDITTGCSHCGSRYSCYCK